MRRKVSLLIAMTATALLLGCGGSSGPMNNNTLPSSTAAAFASQLAGAATQGLSTQVNCTGNSCSTPFSLTLTCPSGGTMQINGSANGPDTGTVTIQATITINNWSCAANTIINGAPNVMVNGTLAFNNGFPAAITQTLQVSGGLQFGSNADVCNINLAVSFMINGNNFSGSVTGTLCGNQINSNFSLPQASQVTRHI